MINGFDEKRDYIEKVSDIMGKTLLIIGISIIIIGTLSIIFFKDCLKYVGHIVVIVVIVGIAIGGYKTNKYRNSV